MNLSVLKNISLDVFIKKARALFVRSVQVHRPVSYDWVFLLTGMLFTLVLLLVIALYFYFFYSTSNVRVVGVDSQTLTINRTELSSTLEALDTHESFFRKEYTSLRSVVDPSI